MREEERSLVRGGVRSVATWPYLVTKMKEGAFFCSNCFIVWRLPRVLGLLYNETEQNPTLWASWEQSSTSGPIKISSGTFCNLVTPQHPPALPKCSHVNRKLPPKILVFWGLDGLCDGPEGVWPWKRWLVLKREWAHEKLATQVLW